MYGFHFVIIYQNETKTKAGAFMSASGSIAYFLTASDARNTLKREGNEDAEKYGYEIHCLGEGEQ